jgi:glycine/D-amino acid oxidase-like deaminating enzyme
VPTDVIIVGGGVAGLSTAALLAPHRRVLLLEREPLLASQASGNNAAIYRPLEHDALSAQLAARSFELLERLAGAGVLARCGLWLVSDSASAIRELARVAVSRQLRHEVSAGVALWQRVPWLAHGQAEHGLCLQDGGVLDLHRMTHALARTARAHGADIRTATSVTRLEYNTLTRRIEGVQLASGEVLRSAHVVLAAGAWSAELAGGVGLGLPLTPLRRHLVQLRATDTQAGWPVVWRLEDEVYFRPESGGVLASPCDESAWPTQTAPLTEPSVLSALAQKLERTAPALANAEVQRAWACLRTFSADRELVIGADSRVSGLYWFAGLGGRGMSVALAAAEILTDEMLSPPAAARYPALNSARLL